MLCGYMYRGKNLIGLWSEYPFSNISIITALHHDLIADELPTCQTDYQQIGVRASARFRVRTWARRNIKDCVPWESTPNAAQTQTDSAGYGRDVRS